MMFCFEDLEVITGGLSATEIWTELSRLRHPMGSGNVMFVASEGLSRQSHEYALRELVTVRNYRDKEITPQRLNEIVRETGDPSVGYGREFKKNMDVEEFLQGNKIISFYVS